MAGFFLLDDTKQGWRGKWLKSPAGRLKRDLHFHNKKEGFNALPFLLIHYWLSCEFHTHIITSIPELFIITIG